VSNVSKTLEETIMTDAKPNINVTPLIDVLLVLLIIFMVVSPLKPTDFKTKIPQESANNSQIETHPDTLIVTLNSESSIRLNDLKGNFGNSENASLLIEKLSQIFNEREQNMAFDKNSKIAKTVFIKAPRNLAYGQVVKIVDAVKIAGAEPISLQIDDLE
jgi:biopolymer transport protein ExbD